MENNKAEILDSGLIKQENTKRRRSLLPWWIKIFIWIFLITGAIAPISVISALLGYQFQISLYGLEANSPLTDMGLFLIAIYLLKGITAFALWTEKDWAITSGQIEASLGICICGFMMIVHPILNIQNGLQLNIRLELLLLIPFLMKLGKIKKDWEKLGLTEPV